MPAKITKPAAKGRPKATPPVNKSQPPAKATSKSTPPVQKPQPKAAAPQKTGENYEPSEMVIKEIMIQKNVSREKAIEILKNPAQ